MAVYTRLTSDELNTLLNQFHLPPLLSWEGASDGIENTTAFLQLADGRALVLTVFEHLSALHLQAYVALLTHLHRHRLPVPAPLSPPVGSAITHIAGKPALLFPRAEGRHLSALLPNQLNQIGRFLGAMHRAVLVNDAPELPTYPYCHHWMVEAATLVEPSLSPADRHLLQEQLALSAALAGSDLPRGIIHGDLFRDNALFHQETLSAVIDFYSAGVDILLLDLAIVANDWVRVARHPQPDITLSALMAGYEEERLLTPEEKAAWPTCLQVAAARFWVSRLKRVVEAAAGGPGLTKNPAEYRQLLLAS